MKLQEAVQAYIDKVATEEVSDSSVLHTIN
jgi:hypothetical protein